MYVLHIKRIIYESVYGHKIQDLQNMVFIAWKMSKIIDKRRYLIVQKQYLIPAKHSLSKFKIVSNWSYNSQWSFLPWMFICNESILSINLKLNLYDKISTMDSIGSINKFLFIFSSTLKIVFRITSTCWKPDTVLKLPSWWENC